MDKELKKELSEVLTAYLSGWKTVSDLYEWLAGVNWDVGSLDADSQQVLGIFELLVTDVFEGFRDEIEFAQEASDFVAKATGSRYFVPKSQAAVVSSASSSDDIVRNLMPIKTASPAEQSWNISPLTASG